jgi:hypothetical protein
VYNVFRFNASLDLTKQMLVMPESIRSDKLPIHEEVWLTYLRDLRNPRHGDIENR